MQLFRMQIIYLIFTFTPAIDDCDPNPCENNGTCIDGINSFICDCVDGFTGDTCEIDIDECLSFPCLNGGTCIDGINSFSCKCGRDFTGVKCEKGTVHNTIILLHNLPAI